MYIFITPLAYHYIIYGYSNNIIINTRYYTVNCYYFSCIIICIIVFLQQRSVNASQCSRRAVRKLCHGVSQLLNCGTTWRLELGARVRLPLLKLNIFLNEMWFCFTIPTRVRKYDTYIMYRKRQITIFTEYYNIYKWRQTLFKLICG